MYRILFEHSPAFEYIRLLNEETQEYVSVIPSFGGNINELILLHDNVLQSIVAGNTSKKELSATHHNMYRGAKLSPFPNRIHSGTYTFESHQYVLQRNDHGRHALHGLLWNKNFAVMKKEVRSDAACMQLQYTYEKEDAGYAFRYQINIEYLLDKNGLTCTTKITNTDERPIPIGDGWHPYITAGGMIDRLQMKLPSNRWIETDNQLIPTGTILPYPTFQELTAIKDTILDHCFELGNDGAIAETILFEKEKNRSIVLWQETNSNGYNYVHIYTPEDRRSIAIEPTSCAPDAFNNKKGLLILEPAESRKFVFGISIR